ncbi:MAG: acyl-CoA dehydrogenase family protein [Acidimicrobiia bacterium]|nr:acyl-CoA dehydrogenase family protein [Acidimicrobiia bacterium]
MYEWPENMQLMRNVVRDFIEKEIVPNLWDLEHGDLPPYDILRKMLKTFGIDSMSRERFRRSIEREEAAARGEVDEERSAGDEGESGIGRDGVAMGMIPIVELSRWCPGMVTAMGVSMGLTGSAIMSKGTLEQKKRWAEEILTLEKVGAWAITEPDSGSDAFGAMKATARRDGDEFVLNGNKTFITNGPYADTIVFICKLDEGNPPDERRVVTFVLDSGMPGLEQSKPMAKMGLHSSPTGELFLNDVRCGVDRLLGGETSLTQTRAAQKEGAKSTFTMERSGVAAMALGIIEQCLQKSLEYAKERKAWGRPIGEYQLIQLKLAKMEVARLNVENLVFRYIEMAMDGRDLSLGEASAMKLYSAQAAVEVAMEAVQLFGGNGYMAEYQVEQLARDSKILQIYGGTDEMQVQHIARDLLSR